MIFWIIGGMFTDALVDDEKGWRSLLFSGFCLMFWPWILGKYIKDNLKWRK